MQLPVNVDVLSLETGEKECLRFDEQTTTHGGTLEKAILALASPGYVVTVYYPEETDRLYYILKGG